MGNDKCNDCGKPLGGTVEYCFDCGGLKPRGGRAIDPHMWQFMLGVEPSNLKDINYKSRDLDSSEHQAHRVAGEADGS